MTPEEIDELVAEALATFGEKAAAELRKKLEAEQASIEKPNEAA